MIRYEMMICGVGMVLLKNLLRYLNDCIFLFIHIKSSRIRRRKTIYFAQNNLFMKEGFYELNKKLFERQLMLSYIGI
jgi:hypothetical protein